MKFDIISVGSAVIDAFVYTDVPEIERKLCYPAGAKIPVRDIKFSTGGSGANCAVGFSRLGLKTGYIGKVGKDENGTRILDELKKEKVIFLGHGSKETTGFSVILDSREHERTILTYRGANDTLSFDELPLRKFDTSWFYLSSMSGESFLTEVQLSEWAMKRGIMIAFNPSSYITKKGVSFIQRLLKNVYILILNDDEARNLVPRGDLFQGLLALGPRIVCITYGKKGNSVSDGKHVFVSYPRPIKLVERTGAGDAFAAGFVSTFIKTKDIRFAIQVGSVNAESVIGIVGAKNGLMNWNKALREIKKRPVRVKERSTPH